MHRQSHASKNKILGFTLVESAIVLILLAILSAILIPQYTQHLMKNERSLSLERLRGAIEYAKTESFIRGKTIILCASRNQKHCVKSSEGEDWSFGYIMFEQSQESEKANETEAADKQILQVFPGIHYGQLLFNAPPPSRLHIHPNGMTMNFGTFSYCPFKQPVKELRSLVVNRAIRSYLTESGSEKE